MKLALCFVIFSLSLLAQDAKITPGESKIGSPPVPLTQEQKISYYEIRERIDAAEKKFWQHQTTLNGCSDTVLVAARQGVQDTRVELQPLNDQLQKLIQGWLKDKPGYRLNLDTKELVPGN